MALEPAHSGPAPDVLEFFRALADETRFAIVRLLAVSDLRSGEIGERLRLPTNALAYHLRQLRAAGMLHDRRSSADGRDVYYHLDIGWMQALYAAGDALYPGMESEMAQGNDQGEPASPLSRPLRVLFLCRHNSARSQMAEAILRNMGGEQVEAFSAKSIPTEVLPNTVAILHNMDIDATGPYAKPLERFIGEPFDYIITVCDRVRDICPSFPGDPTQAHWSIADPAVVEDPERRAAAFRATAQELITRIRYLLLLPHPGTGERMRPRR